MPEFCALFADKSHEELDAIAKSFHLGESLPAPSMTPRLVQPLIRAFCRQLHPPNKVAERSDATRQGGADLKCMISWATKREVVRRRHLCILLGVKTASTRGTRRALAQWSCGPLRSLTGPSKLSK